MAALILVTGGTGRLGKPVVRRLRAQGKVVRVLSRRPHGDEAGVEFVVGDLSTGAGVDEAVAGADTVVHCASAKKGDAEATRHLIRAAVGAGVTHLIFVSIVGAERLGYAYVRTKLECEQLVIGSGLPWTILRATQFHDLVLTGTRRLARLPVVPVPAGFDIQPVDADEVAARLVELAAQPPAGRVADVAGPHVESYASLVRTYLSVNGKRRPVVPLWLPGLGKVRGGGMLPGDGADLGVRSWRDFLVGAGRGAGA